MSSPSSSGNSYATPQSSPEITEADLRSLEHTLDSFREYLQDTVHTFEEYSHHFNSINDHVVQQLEFTQSAESLNNQVSAPETNNNATVTDLQQQLAQLDDILEVRQPLQPLGTPAENPRRNSYPFFTARLPIYPRTRPLSSSLSSSIHHMSSSQESDSLFGSPNNSLGHIEFEFHGFETTNGISNTPTLGQQNNTETTMSHSDTQSGASELGVEQIQPSQWIRFQSYAHSQLRTISKELKTLSTQLQEPSLNQSVPQISAHMFRTTRFRSKLSQLEDRLEEITYEETVPEEQLDQINEDIAKLANDIDVQHALIEEMISQAREKSTESDAVANALRQVANTPTVELPKFDGKTIDYQSFKQHFEFVIQKVNGPKELWATHLLNSLQGPVKQYIGAGNKWFNKYEGLWKMLDSKYDNKWTLNHETVSTFFYNTLTSEEPDPVKNFVYTQLDNISSIEALGLSPGELCTTVLLESLPMVYKNILKDALRQTYPNKVKASFNTEEFRKVFNDTIGAIQDETALPSKYPPSFIAHYGHQQQRKRGKGRGSGHGSNKPQPQPQPQPQPNAQPTPAAHPTPAAQPPQGAQPPSAVPTTPVAQPLPGNNPPSQPQHYNQNGNSGYNQRGHYQGYRGHRWRGSSRGGRGGYGLSNRRQCYICQDDSRFYHFSLYCPNFPTPALRRQQLEATGRCNCCTRQIHAGECEQPRECQYHPGEIHWQYLCMGEPHPGKNA